ncbi:MAG TPA: hypothetical protein VIP46_00625 [Pyrinomonadaceae bacterium]
MNTKGLMVASSLALGLAGIAASFAPSELLRALGSPAAEPLPVLIQLLGAVYFAFAMTNWIAKDNVIGGIYSRPISLGNCVHFIVGALALAKQQFSHGVSMPLVAVLIAYTLFAICFAWLVFGRGAACKVAAPERQSPRH